MADKGWPLAIALTVVGVLGIQSCSSDPVTGEGGCWWCCGWCGRWYRGRGWCCWCWCCWRREAGYVEAG